MASDDDAPEPSPPKLSKPVRVNLAHTKYGLVRRCVKDMGWKVTSSQLKSILFWSDSEGTIEFCHTLERWQFCNHFPGMWAIAHKVEFVRIYSRLSWQLPDIYDFHPKSFILPLQLDLLQTYMASFPKRSDRTIIVKPDRGSQGRGIHLIQDYEDLEDYSESAVAQTYLSPLLLNGKKFDLRIYVLVTSCDPLRVYTFKEGMVRFCTENYQQPKPANLDEAFLHLTNFSLNKHNSAFEFSENKRYLTVVFNELSEHGIDVNKVRSEIHRIVRLTLIAGQPVISSSYHTGIRTNDGRSRCFEILGFDILLDSQAKPWLLEVNCMPSLSAPSQFDGDLKSQVISDVLRVIDLKASFRAEVLKRFKNVCAQRLGAQSDQAFDPDRETEIARSTGWEQLLPVLDDSDMAQLCDKVVGNIRESGLQKRVQPQTSAVLEAEAPKHLARPRPGPRTRPNPRPPEQSAAKLVKTFAVPKQKLAVARPIVTRQPRSVTLANEARSARLNALGKRLTFTEPTPIFMSLHAEDSTMPIIECEERERIMALRKQAQLATAVSMAQCLRMLFPNGKVAMFDREDVPCSSWHPANFRRL